MTAMIAAVDLAFRAAKLPVWGKAREPLLARDRGPDRVEVILRVQGTKPYKVPPLLVRAGDAAATVGCHVVKVSECHTIDFAYRLAYILVDVGPAPLQAQVTRYPQFVIVTVFHNGVPFTRSGPDARTAYHKANRALRHARRKAESIPGLLRAGDVSTVRRQIRQAVPQREPIYMLPQKSGIGSANEERTQ